MPENLKKALNQIAPNSVEWLGIREVTERATTRYVRDGKPQANDVSESKGAMVEVLVNGQWAYAATSNITLDGLRDAAQRASQLAQSASKWALFSGTPELRPAVKARYESSRIRAPESLRAREANDFLIQITQRLRTSPKIIRASAVLSFTETQMKFVSTSGADATQDFHLIATDFEATAQEGPITQKRTDGGFRARCYQGGLEFLYTDDLWARIDRTREEAVELLSASPCPSETCDLILMPDQMMLQIHESIGHPLEIDRILGDERNYAGWSFVKPEDFGKLQYGSKLMNITFDPTISHQFASYAFDDIGNTSKKEFLIKEGLLIRGLGSLESQARSQIPGVANQRASLWNRAPIDRMANLNLEPGDSSLDEMISNVDRGVLMHSNRSWSIDDFRNKFQFGCEYAKLIEKGKVTRTLRNPNYRGISVPFWRSLSMVGKQDEFQVFGTPYCGKGEPNQVIRVGHASPPCLFRNVEVFGGEEA